METLVLAVLTTAGPLAVLIVAAISAVQKRVPALDGWRVLVVAGVLAVALVSLFLPIVTLPDVLAAGRVAVVAWLLAVGGDAWAARIAGKAASKVTTVTVSPLDEGKP
jgi:hypothetical protein